MKKYICTMLCLLLSVLLVFSLAACQDSSNDPAITPGSSSEPTAPTQPTEPPYVPASAAELWENVDAAMNALTSMEGNMVTEVVYYMMGYELRMESTTLSISTKDAEYIESEIKTVCDEIELDETVRTVKAYYEGKMYSGHTDNHYDQKLCSVATKEAYADAMSGSLSDEINVAECTSGKFSKNPDGTWALEFTGYTGKTINKVLDTLGMSGDVLGAPIEDLKITVLAQEDFLVKSMTIAFLFEEGDGTVQPEYSSTIEYSKYNTATFDPEMLKAEEYVEVDDLFVLKMLEDGIKERQDAASGNFVLEVKETTRYYGQNFTSKETDIITYGKKNGAYYYSMIGTTDDTEMTLVYQNGVQTITASGEVYTYACTDAEAKAMVDGLINTAAFATLSVTNIEKEGEGVYILTCEDIDLSAYAGNVVEGVTLEYGEQAIKVTFKDGKLVKIDSLLCLEGKYEYNDLELDVKTVVDFEKDVEYPTI